VGYSDTATNSNKKEVSIDLLQYTDTYTLFFFFSNMNKQIIFTKKILPKDLLTTFDQSRQEKMSNEIKNWWADFKDLEHDIEKNS